MILRGEFMAGIKRVYDLAAVCLKRGEKVSQVATGKGCDAN